MARAWQLQEAKNRFSELVERALSRGPQVVTRMAGEIRRSQRGLQREGFRQVWNLSSDAEIDAATVEPKPLWTDRRVHLKQEFADALKRMPGGDVRPAPFQDDQEAARRMINQDVIDLYERVPLGAKVVVLPARS